MDPQWGSMRIRNLMAGWHNQLLEILGVAMGIARCAGCAGRWAAMFQEDLEKEFASLGKGAGAMMEERTEISSFSAKETPSRSACAEQVSYCDQQGLQQLRRLHRFCRMACTRRASKRRAPGPALLHRPSCREERILRVFPLPHERDFIDA